MGLRRKSREIALKVMYALNFFEKEEENNLEDSLKKLIKDMVKEELSPESNVFQFSLELLKNTLTHLEEIDEKIKKYSLNWDFSRIAILEKSILRLAIYEILFSSTPDVIVINEAIELSKKFCEIKTSAFINGILNSLVKNKDE